MPRVKLTPLDRYDFTWRLSVRTPDLNRANHMSAYALVGILDEAYARFIDHLDLGQPGLGARNVSSINGDLQIVYLGEGQLHDELDIELGVREVSRRSRVHYRIQVADKPIALAEIGAVCFDYVAKKAVALPKVFLDALDRHSAASVAGDRTD